MITITPINNINVFITNNWITVARGSGAHLISLTSNVNTVCPGPFPSPIVWVPSNPISINSSTTFNAISTLFSATTPCDLQNLTINYEVIEPKVIYERIAGTTSINFIDVTTKSTNSHTHSIPVSNTTWMQNPNITRGRIAIEKFNTTTSLWEIVDYVPLNSQKIVKGLTETTCIYRTRFEYRLIANCGGTSPLIFEAIGQSFNLSAYLYETPSPNITKVESTSGTKIFSCYQNNKYYITTEANNIFTIYFKSSNIGYTYTYGSSSICTIPTPNFIPNLTYFTADFKLTGRFTNAWPLQQHKNQFTGTATTFINGILVTGVTPYQESISFYLESIKPTLNFNTQQNCNLLYTVCDDSKITNPCLIDKIDFYIEKKTSNVWNSCFNSKPGSCYTTDACSTGIQTLRTKLKYVSYVKTDSCGCDSTPTPKTEFETDWYEYTFNILDYKPIIELPVLNCCYPVNSVLNIIPTSLDPNNDKQDSIEEWYWSEGYCDDLVTQVAHPDTLIDLITTPAVTCVVGQTSTLIYQYYSWNYKTSTWLENVAKKLTYVVPDPLITPIVLANFNYSLTLDKLGAGKVIATHTNCCTKTVKELLINTCKSVELLKDCYNTTTLCDCTKYKFVNNSPTNNYTITINKSINGVFTQIDQFTLNSSLTKDYTFQDGVYKINYLNTTIATDNWVELEYVFCAIDKCYTDFLSKAICCSNDTCNDKICEDTKYKTNKIMALYQMYMMLVQEEQKLNQVYTEIDITNKLTTITKLDDLRKKLEELCIPCKTKECVESGNTTFSNSSFSNNSSNSNLTSNCGCK
jgi:hypothetical protein